MSLWSKYQKWSIYYWQVYNKMYSYVFILPCNTKNHFSKGKNDEMY